MLISNAHAAVDVANTAAPAAADSFWMNMGLIGVMFVLFYILLIRPQQRRLKEQREMLDALQTGDTVVTSGGLVGTVSKIMSDTEVEIDLGQVKVVALRYTIQTKMDEKKAVSPTKTDAVKAEKKPKAVKAAKTAKATKTAKADKPAKVGRPAKAVKAAKPAVKKTTAKAKTAKKS